MLCFDILCYAMLASIAILCYDLLDMMFHSELPDTTPGPTVTAAAAHQIEKKVTAPERSSLEVSIDLCDLFDKLPLSASDRSAPCNNLFAKLTVNSQVSVPEDTSDWWDSFDVSGLSGACRGNAEKVVFAKAPSSKEGYDELEDFLNSLG